MTDAKNGITDSSNFNGRGDTINATMHALGDKVDKAQVFDSLMLEAVTSGAAPFLVGMTATTAGVTWSGAAGDSASGIAASQDTVFRIYSMSKSICATAAAILVDRGQLDLDAMVENILPTFAKLGIVAKDSGGHSPLLAAGRKATVRQLATHTSGLGYEFWDAVTARYLAESGRPSVLTGSLAGMAYPLLFEPGTRWQYGIGVDWLGLVIEAVDGRRVDRFCQEEIFGPLQMGSTRFEANLDPKLADVFARSSDGIFERKQLDPPSNPEVYSMGSAVYSTPSDYIRFLRMFLGHGELDGARILSSEMVSEMLANQIGDLRIQSLSSTVPSLSGDLDVLPGVTKSQSLGFARLEEDVPGRRAAGSQFWGGVLNTHFWFDPACDVSAVLMTQSLPFLDPAFMSIYERFESIVYEGG
jgi:CubicO group peptidase (beta-lactamase class C family)